MTEAGIKGFEASVWWCMVAPAGTPPDVVAILNAGVRAALSEAALSDKLTTLGVITCPTTPVELGEFLAAEVRTWGDVIPRGNIEAE